MHMGLFTSIFIFIIKNKVKISTETITFYMTLNKSHTDYSGLCYQNT